jgi:hypothetical protein
MNYHFTDFPLFILVLSFLLLWLAGRIGTWFRKRSQKADEAASADAGLILGATLTLLGLIIGFTFSMSISRYEERKTLEAHEANAIGTEYVRGDVLPASDAQRMRALLTQYTQQRILFYEASREQQLRRVNADTAQLEKDLWSSVVGPANSQTTPLTALAVSGMNDVLNSQGYTQAAWWNRIPSSAWVLMVMIALSCNLLIGYSTHRTRAESTMFLVLSLIVAVSFFLIADIDSPRGGIIRVQPENLLTLSQSFHPQ